MAKKPRPWWEDTRIQDPSVDEVTKLGVMQASYNAYPEGVPASGRVPRNPAKAMRYSVPAAPPGVPVQAKQLPRASRTPRNPEKRAKLGLPPLPDFGLDRLRKK
jgi:hypothetical protein